MRATEAEIKNLVHQHQAIQAHMKFLAKAISGVPSPHIPKDVYATTLRERISIYRWSLYDFREAIQRQMEIDERILSGTGMAKGILKEYRAIQAKIDRAINLAENVVYNQIDPQELRSISLTLKEIVNKICKIIEKHVAKENELVAKR